MTLTNILPSCFDAGEPLGIIDNTSAKHPTAATAEGTTPRSPEQAITCIASDLHLVGVAIGEATVEDHGSAARAEQIEKLARLGTFEVDFDTSVLKWSEGTYRIFGLDPNNPVSLERALRFFDPPTRCEIESRLERARLWSALRHQSAVPALKR